MEPRNIEEDLQWYEIRDLFVGRSLAIMNIEQDLKRELELATRCQHPEARWLVEVFAGRVVTTVEEALAVLEEKKRCALSVLCSGALRPLGRGSIAKISGARLRVCSGDDG